MGGGGGESYINIWDITQNEKYSMPPLVHGGNPPFFHGPHIPYNLQFLSLPLTIWGIVIIAGPINLKSVLSANYKLHRFP